MPVTTPASAFRVELCTHAIMAAIEASVETEAEACESLFNVLAARLVDLGIPAERAGEHFAAAMRRAYAATVEPVDAGETEH